MWIIDKVLRLAAIATSAVAGLLAFFAGIFAAIARSLPLQLAGLAIIIGGGAIVAYVLIASFASPMKKARSDDPHRSRVPVATACVYLVGILGLVGGAALLFNVLTEKPVQLIDAAARTTAVEAQPKR